MNNIVIIFFLFLLSSCATKIPLSDDPDIAKLQTRVEDHKLASINIIDRNGLSETIGAKERLKTYENVDFLSSQSYQKVLRVFSRDKTGKALAVITSYYPSGQIKQYLEVVNGRASGTYLEWHQNGEKKLRTEILGGNADLDEKSQSGWTFDSTSYCWNESGTLAAEIQYEKGQLVGCAKYFHADGSLAEQVPYEKGEIHGEMVTFDTDGTVLEKTSFSSGLKEGPSLGFWEADKTAWEETWHEDLLQEGSYYDRNGALLYQVIEGTGQRCIFSDTGLSELHEYRQGKEEGQVRIFDGQKQLTQTIHVKDGMKHGEEIYYWISKTETSPQPRLSIEWYMGNIHGTAKSWYDNGTQESQREMSHNAKQGLLTAWYRDGQLMMIEEYEKDRLRRGDYLKRGETAPISKVADGTGTATIYDADGTFVRRIAYHEGKAIDDDNVK